MTVFLLLGFVLYQQLFVRQDVGEISNQFSRSIGNKGGWFLLVSAIALMPLNWFLESYKWKILVNNFQSFSIRQSISSILSGVSMAIMTPGRVGEYGGRLVGINPENRPKAILANLVSSLSQNIINIGVGLTMSVLFLNRYMSIQQGIFVSLFTISVLVIGALLLAYFRIDLISGLLAYLPDYKWVNKIRESVSSFSGVDNRMLFRILGISFFRYSIYFAQYVLFIYFFGVTDQLLPAILGVGTIFFLQSNLPLPPALSVFARGEMAIFLWQVFTNNIFGIIAATFSLWILNLVIPAILGAIVISRSRIFED